MYDLEGYPPYVPNVPSAPNVPDRPDYTPFPDDKPRIAWGGVLAVAFVAPIFLALLTFGIIWAYMFVARIGNFDNSWGSILLVGIIAYFVPVVITLRLATKHLNKIGIQHSFIILIASAAVAYAVLKLLISLLEYLPFYSDDSVEEIFTNFKFFMQLIPLILPYFAFVVAVVLFVLFSMRSSDKIDNMRGPLMIVVAAAFVGATFLIPSPSQAMYTELENKNLRNEFSWIYLPTHTIEGVKGIEECQNVSTGYVISCTLTLENFPGYLKETTIATVMSTVNGDITAMDNYELFDVWIGRDDERISDYKMKDETCDVPGLRQELEVDYGDEYSEWKNKSVKPKRCAAVTTTGGTKLYYESYLNYGEDAAPVPNLFYFEKDETVVIIDFDVVGYFKQNQLNSYIAGSEETRDELYKFIDSFKPYSEVKQ